MPVRWLGVQNVSMRFADPLGALPIRIRIRIRVSALGEHRPVATCSFRQGTACCWAARNSV
jgi:hypothetical protein